MAGSKLAWMVDLSMALFYGVAALVALSFALGIDLLATIRAWLADVREQARIDDIARRLLEW